MMRSLMSGSTDSPAALAGPGGPRRRPGGTDVARLAGVSQKTVSRVMNDEAHVKEEVRQRVLAAARQLGYRRNNQARALTSGRTNRIGVVSLGSALFGPSSLLIAIERAARSTGFTLSVVNTFEGDAGGVAGAVDTLLEEGVDGIVLSEPIDEGPQPITADVPVLTLGGFPGLIAPCVIRASGPGDQAGYFATRHLLSLGHQQIRHVAGPQRWWSARDRADGWARAVREAGLAAPSFIEGDWSPASGYLAGRALASDHEMTAVFAANDDMAIGLIRALAESGRSVPDNVSVIGMDDIPSAAYLNPPLTTIAQDFDRMAVDALRKLVVQIEDPTAPDIPPDQADAIQLIVRNSTAPIAAGSSSIGARRQMTISHP
jgi:DNA-binding LacI/PurR family transcriptional regulator